MRRAALAVPAAALARIAYRTGKFVSANWTGLNYPFDVSIVGTDNTIRVNSEILLPCPSEDPEVICFSFSSGTVTVQNPRGHTLFMGSLREGLIVSKLGSVDLEITASLLPEPGVSGGSLDFTVFSQHGEQGGLSGPGYASVFVSTTAEPGTVGLLENNAIDLSRFGETQAQAADIESASSQQRTSQNPPA